MTARLPVPVIFWVLLAGSPGAEAEAIRYETLRAHDDRVGPVHLRMNVDKASARLGVDIEEAPYQYGDQRCSSYAFGESEYDWDLRFIVSQGRVGKIDIYTEAIRTPQGLGVGSTPEAIRAVYGDRIRLKPGHQAGESKLLVRTGNNRYLVFAGWQPGEIKPGMNRELKPPERVRYFSIGVRGVGSVEGCL